MRLSAASLRRVVKGDLTIQFVPQALTSYGGTIDVDGSVIRTGSTVRWAFRGFNPHHRNDPSYYPLFAHVAQTGHILPGKNRPGNADDSKQAVPFLREIIKDLRGRFGRRVALEFRMDAAFLGRLLELAAAQTGGRRLPPVGAGGPGGAWP